MKYIIAIIFVAIIFVGCIRNPVGISPIEVYHGADSLQYAGYYSVLDQSTWTGEYGITFYTAAHNTGEKDWYGHPEIDIYTSDILLTSFNKEDSIGHGKGILTTRVDRYYIVPLDTIEFIPAKEISESLTFVKIEYSDLKRYYYVLWSFGEE